MQHNIKSQNCSRLPILGTPIIASHLINFVALPILLLLRWLLPHLTEYLLPASLHYASQQAISAHGFWPH